MQALAFWKTVVADDADLLERLVAALHRDGIRYCVVGGQAVNAYVEPLVSLDLDLAVAADQLSAIGGFARHGFRVEPFAHSLNISVAGSHLRVQVQTDPRYAAFVDRATPRNVLGLTLPVAAVDDVLRGKIWAAQDSTRRASKRQKDFADIARLLEAYPQLREQVPPAILTRLL
jgi:hypothetical protein